MENTREAKFCDAHECLRVTECDHVTTFWSRNLLNQQPFFLHKGQKGKFLTRRSQLWCCVGENPLNFIPVKRLDLTFGVCYMIWNKVSYVLVC